MTLAKKGRVLGEPEGEEPGTQTRERGGGGGTITGRGRRQSIEESLTPPKKIAFVFPKVRFLSEHSSLPEEKGKKVCE